LHSEPSRCFFPNVLTSEFHLPTLSLSGTLRICPFRTAGTSRHVCRFRAADNFCRVPKLSWVIFLAPRRHRTAKLLQSSCRSTAVSVASAFAFKPVTSILSQLPSFWGDLRRLWTGH
jgi:hypothetical protein